MNERFVWADALRGLLILLVVLGHSLQFGDYENRLSWNVIYSFHMATFFVVSGFVSYKKKYRFTSLSKKATLLLLPFLTWTCIGGLVHGDLLDRLVNALLHPDSSYWFIFILFLIISLFTFVRNLPPTPPKKCLEVVELDYRDAYLLGVIVGLILFMVMTEFRLIGYQFLALYFGFYVYGYWLRKFEINFKIFWLVTIGIVWLGLSLFWRMHEVPLPFKQISFLPSSLLTYTYRYITAFVGSMFFVSFAMNFMNRENGALKLLCYLGRISLGIYIIHLFLGKPITFISEQLCNSKESVWFVMCYCILGVLTSVLLINILQRIPIVRLLLLGKNK